MTRRVPRPPDRHRDDPPRTPFLSLAVLVLALLAIVLLVLAF